MTAYHITYLLLFKTVASGVPAGSDCLSYCSATELTQCRSSVAEWASPPNTSAQRRAEWRARQSCQSGSGSPLGLEACARTAEVAATARTDDLRAHSAQREVRLHEDAAADALVEGRSYSQTWSLRCTVVARSPRTQSAHPLG